MSIDDYLNNSTGLLDSDNTYVAEYLLRVAADLQPSVFFQRVQAGFVVSYQEPVLSFCGQTNETLNVELSDLIEAVCNCSTDMPIPSVCRPEIERCEMYLDDTICECEEALECLGKNPFNMTVLPAGYHNNLSYSFQMDFSSSVCPNDFYECSISDGTNLAAQIYPPEKEALTATVWYNNQVSTNK